MTTFTIGDNTITAKKFDFNLVCDLEDMGISIQEIGKKPMATVRAYIALSAGVTMDMAGQMMEEHILNGGSLEGVMGAMSKEMQDSDFFRNLNKPTTPKKVTKASK